MHTNPLVFVEDNKVVTDSLKVSEVFEKQHFHVMRDIESLDCSLDFLESNFGLWDYKDLRDRSRKKYLLTKDGLMFLVMGYRGAKAAQMKERYIEEFNRMEQFIKTEVKLDSYMIQDPIERATRWIEEEQERLYLEAKVNEQASKVEFHDKVLRPGELLTATTLSKDYGLTARRFNLLLHDLGIQFRQGGKWHLYSKYATHGYTDYETYEDGYTQMKWTQKGRQFLYQFLQDRGFVPVGQAEKERLHTRKEDIIALTAY
ncbi:Rha family phage regulatory protein [Croceifilum oryzae]|uniref:Rha family phage regulatory protein n=1 Tax=Croceifilum oryzae TaxID=1553429 RepID=A0AAJ1WQU6_9BACL|nr:phage regulatory protein/antirepressor Ant [Croceifilum oryzae]MDQ0417897.1 Rha family phage regulatory protein [Croceifilum oryzae]